MPGPCTFPILPLMGKVFDPTLPMEHVAEGYRAMDERRAIKALLVRAVASAISTIASRIG